LELMVYLVWIWNRQPKRVTRRHKTQQERRGKTLVWTRGICNVIYSYKLVWIPRHIRIGRLRVLLWLTLGVLVLQVEPRCGLGSGCTICIVIWASFWSYVHSLACIFPVHILCFYFHFFASLSGHDRNLHGPCFPPLTSSSSYCLLSPCPSRKTIERISPLRLCKPVCG
jgi:hypothetical protein